MSETQPIWTPSTSRANDARVVHWMSSLRERRVLPDDVRSVHALQRWSVDNLEAFWAEVWRETAIAADGPGPAHAPWREILHGAERMAPPDPAHGPRWFTEARLNYAERLLRRRDDHPAIVAWNEHGPTRRISYAQLAVEVARAAAALSACGVRAGDRVAGFLPNIPEAVVMMLAASALGAIWSSSSPDFGTSAVLDRFGQIEPLVLVAANGYVYDGKRIDCMPRIREIAAALPSLQSVWIIDNLDEAGDNAAETPIDSNMRPFGDVIRQYVHIVDPAFARLPFDHPLVVLYSSGTTGLPKGIVHGAGGTLLQHWKEHALHVDMSDRDVVFYFTTCGWMMWNWLASALAQGSTLVLYDGAAMPREADILWRMAAAESVTVFGTSAKYLSLCEKQALAPRTSHDLSALRTILSTGSPLAPTAYDYVYSQIARDVALQSISGGTDIVSCFALGDPTSPIYRGELGVRGLGMAVDVWGSDGAPIVGTPGELVCTRPFPSMPVSFWNDEDRARYQAAYFSEIAGVWRHGDWAERTLHDGLVIHGRSDTTLNPGGVRIGTAEIYRQVEQVASVLESVVIEQQMGDAAAAESRLVLFVRMQPGSELTAAVQQEIRHRIREGASPHHVPRIIAEVTDIPRTISGKITEVAVRNAVHGRPNANLGALANPGSLAQYERHPALQALS